MLTIITNEQLLGIGLSIVAIIVIGLLIGIPIVERIKVCKQQYGKDWRKHF